MVGFIFVGLIVCGVEFRWDWLGVVLNCGVWVSVGWMCVGLNDCCIYLLLG